jgi:hypothetical protein
VAPDPTRQAPPPSATVLTDRRPERI